MSSATFKHSAIGELKGKKVGEDVVQYLGLQYATLRDRFATPVLKEYSKSETIDATKVGPQTVAIPDGPQMEQSLIQHTLPADTSDLTASDTEGLNLNITLPSDTANEQKLPVFVFIHGGGFMVGSATWPQYDLARFVQLSVEKDLPCIAINLNYRLGPPGFLTSKEMQDVGYKPNNGLRDQRTALLWVQKYIDGFGGDPESVTLAGESAGSVSCTFHMQSREPLFKRVLLMSGTDLLIPTLPPQVVEGAYQGAIKALGLESASPEERMKVLLSIDATELRSKLMAAPMLPVLDEDLPLVPHTFADFASGKLDLAGTSWCEAMMIGDCQFDGNIQGLRLMHRKNNIATAFCDSMQKSFSTAEYTDRLLQGYSINRELDDETAFFRILEVMNDIGFYAPTTAYAEALSKKMKTYVYRFNEPNPWDGPYKGHANHILDIAFLFQNFNDYLDEPQRELAEEFAEDVLSFAHGEEPWEQWGKDRRVAQVLGPEGDTETMEDVPQKVGRRKILLELAEQVPGGMDHLSEVLNTFMRGPPPV